MHHNKLPFMLLGMLAASSQTGCGLPCMSWQCLGEGGAGGSGGSGEGGTGTTSVSETTTGGSGGMTTSSSTGGGGSGGIAGTGGNTGGAANCVIESSDPMTGAAEVSIDSAIHVHWTEAIDSASATGALVLTDADGADVPLTVTLDPDGKSVTAIAANAGLRIWQTYTLQVLTAQSLAGLPCAGATATFSTGGPIPEERPLLAAALNGVTVLDGRLYGVSADYRGLQTFQLSPVSLTGEVLTAASPRSLVPATPTLAFAPATFDGVARFGGSPLAFVDILDTPGNARDVAPFQANGAFRVAVADTTGGLRLLAAAGADGMGPMTDLGAVAPNAPQVTGSMYAVDASPDGSLIAASNGASIFVLSSVTPLDPSSFQLEAVLPLAASDLRLDGDRLFVALGGGGLSYYDVSAPDAPLLMGTACVGNAACKPSRLWSAGSDVFAIIDKKTAARFVVDGVAGTLTLASTYVASSPIRGITSDGVNTFLATDEGVAYAQASAVAPSMALVGPPGFGPAEGAVRVGSDVYVASQMLGLLTFDWPVGGSPARVDKDLTPGTSLDFASGALATFGNNRVVDSDGRGGICVFGLDAPANPANPELLWNSQPMDNGGYTVVRDHFAYVCAASAGVQILDLLSLPAPGDPVPTLPLPAGDGCWDLEVSGDRLYMIGYTPGGALFRVADISNPTAPTWKQSLATFPELESGTSIAVSNGRIFFTGRKLDPSGTGAYRRHLGEVLAPDDGSTPTLSYLSDEIGAQHVNAVGPFLFVASGPSGLRTYRVDPGLPPVLLGTSATLGNASETETDAGGLLVAERQGGIERFRTGIPSN